MDPARLVLTTLLVAALSIGVTTAVWTAAGVVRSLLETRERRRRRRRRSSGWMQRPLAVPPPRRDEVCVLVAAHNEELVIAATIRSAAAQVPLSNVFVASDGSTDGTIAVAEAAGATVLDIDPNRGKAGAIVTAIERLHLAERFEVLLLLDADTQLAPDYLTTGLALLDSADVVAVAGRASTLASPRPRHLMGRLLIAYRERVYVAVQYLHKFGQAGARANVVTIVPGFASLYRTRILADIDIDARGLSIEDYNMTFEVHAKRLGRIAFHPRAAIAYTQDPETLADYVSQVKRWNLGFWQTVRRHRFQPRLFWAALSVFVVEVVAASIMLLALIPLFLFSLFAPLIASALVGGPGPLGGIGDLAVLVDEILPPAAIALGFLGPDLLLTLLLVIVDRRPSVLMFALVFPFLRILDAVLCLRALARALGRESEGRWRSPARRSVGAIGDTQPSAAASMRPTGVSS